MKLEVKLLEEGAKLPELGKEGDLGYDLFALEETPLYLNVVNKVRTGIAIKGTDKDGNPLGFKVNDRSSMAEQGVSTVGRVVDSGYRGEVVVMLTLQAGYPHPKLLKAGQKFAQIVPTPVLATDDISVVEGFEATARGTNGFGSTGTTAKSVVAEAVVVETVAEESTEATQS